LVLFSQHSEKFSSNNLPHSCPQLLPDVWHKEIWEENSGDKIPMPLPKAYTQRSGYGFGSWMRGKESRLL
jgi:hypothetical protein